MTAMSVSFAPSNLRVPPGFEHILTGLATEVLREQPSDVISFAAEYFKSRLALRQGSLYSVLISGFLLQVHIIMYLKTATTCLLV